MNFALFPCLFVFLREEFIRFIFVIKISCPVRVVLQLSVKPRYVTTQPGQKKKYFETSSCAGFTFFRMKQKQHIVHEVFMTVCEWCSV